MYIGEPVRTLSVEPVVDPVPDRDLPGRSARLRPVPPRTTPQAVAMADREPDREPEVVATTRD